MGVGWRSSSSPSIKRVGRNIAERNALLPSSAGGEEGLPVHKSEGKDLPDLQPQARAGREHDFSATGEGVGKNRLFRCADRKSISLRKRVGEITYIEERVLLSS